MNLSTTYCGMRLSSPLMPGASPLVDDLDMVRRLEDAGASAIVMHSLFEEQIDGEKLADIYHREIYCYSTSEAHSYFPRGHDFALGPDQYLEQIERIKGAVAVPVVASLNGTTLSGWVEYAALMQQAGADAVELNVYHIPTDPLETSAAVEQRLLEIVRAVKESAQIPLAVKLSPYFSSLPSLAGQLDELKVEAMVLFNRFYQADIDIEALEHVPRLHLSDPTELPLRLHWLSILSGHCLADLACSGGVHNGRGAIQAIMAGASAVQMVSGLLKQGPEHLRVVRQEMEQWMMDHEYDSVRQMHRSMSMLRCPDPSALQRGNYMRVLQSVGPNGAKRTFADLQEG
jgi:dihydroorotate dehydrogenase (fumarate)